MALPPLSKLPSPQLLEKSAKVEAWVEDEKKVLFESIYEKDKTIVVLIHSCVVSVLLEARPRFDVFPCVAGHLFCGVSVLSIVVVNAHCG